MRYASRGSQHWNWLSGPVWHREMRQPLWLNGGSPDRYKLSSALSSPNCERQTKIIGLQLQWDLVRVAEGRDEMSHSGERDRYISAESALSSLRDARSQGLRL